MTYLFRFQKKCMKLLPINFFPFSLKKLRPMISCIFVKMGPNWKYLPILSHLYLITFMIHGGLIFEKKSNTCLLESKLSFVNFRRDSLARFCDVYVKGTFFSEDIMLLVGSPYFANILLFLCTEKCTGAVKCLQNMAIWQVT